MVLRSELNSPAGLLAPSKYWPPSSCPCFWPADGSATRCRQSHTMFFFRYYSSPESLGGVMAKKT